MAETTIAAEAALVTKFGYTNTTASTKNVTLQKLGIVTNYTRNEVNTSSTVRTVNSSTNKTGQKVTNTTTKTVQDDLQKTRFGNLTTPLTQGELLTYKSQQVKELKTDIPVYNPSPVPVPGVVWGVRADEVLETTNPEKPGWRQQSPMFCAISFGNELSPYVDANFMEQALIRALSMLYDDDGKFRGPELMRGSTTPSQN